MRRVFLAGLVCLALSFSAPAFAANEENYFLDVSFSSLINNQYLTLHMTYSDEWVLGRDLTIRPTIFIAEAMSSNTSNDVRIPYGANHAEIGRQQILKRPDGEFAVVVKLDIFDSGVFIESSLDLVWFSSNGKTFSPSTAGKHASSQYSVTNSTIEQIEQNTEPGDSRWVSRRPGSKSDEACKGSKCN